MSDKVLTANHLISGEVVFLGEGELWSPEINEALVASSADDESWLERAGRRAIGAQVVVEPYLIDVERQGGALTPVRLRERIRTGGPTIRTDLTRQTTSH